MTSGEHPQRLYFYFDFISHNAWLAWTQMQPLCAEYGLSLEPVPVLFAALLQRYEQRGPAEVPPKSAWMLDNVLRKARDAGIPIAAPASHPFNPLAALRAVAAVDEQHRVAVVDRLFRATWTESRPVHEPAEIACQLAACGLDAETLTEAAGTETVKRRIRENTDAAIAAGVFGVPSMRLSGELFFGYDDLHWLRRFASGDTQMLISAETRLPWAAVRPSAQRKPANRER